MLAAIAGTQPEQLPLQPPSSLSKRRRAFAGFSSGMGRYTSPLKSAVSRRIRAMWHSSPTSPQSGLRKAFAAIDVHLVSLRPELEGLIVPSKFYGIAAAGRPTIFIGDLDGEIARLISKYECGLTVGKVTALDWPGPYGSSLRTRRCSPWESAREAFDAEFNEILPSRDGRNYCEKLLACRR